MRSRVLDLDLRTELQAHREAKWREKNQAAIERGPLGRLQYLARVLPSCIE